MRKLAIVGSHPDTRGNAPFDNPDYDIWVFNEAAQANPTDTPHDPDKQWCRRWDACFQLHKPEIYTSPYNRSNKNHWDWLQRHHGPNKIIWMQDKDPSVPNSLAYPIDDIVNMAGVRWLTSSIAYAVALGVYIGYRYIDLYGCDLTSNTEYQYQAEGLKAWIMFARGRGVNVTLHCWPNAFVAPLYGYDGEVQLGQAYYSERVNVHNAAWRAADKNLGNVRKAIERHIDRAEWEKVRDSILSYQDAALLAGEAAGKLSEAQKYSAYGERPVYRQEYEMSMARAQRDGDAHTRLMYHTGGMIEYTWNVVKQSGQAGAVRQLTDFLWKMGRHAYDSGAQRGIFAENAQYMGLFDGLVQAAGGQRSISAVIGDTCQ